MGYHFYENLHLQTQYLTRPIEASLFVEGSALSLGDRVALLAGFVGALLLIHGPAILPALGLEGALPEVNLGADQLAVLTGGGGDTSGQVGQ